MTVMGPGRATGSATESGTGRSNSEGRGSDNETRTANRVTALRRAFTASAAQQLATPSSLVAFGLFFIIPPAVLAMVWKAAAEGSGGSIVGYSASALVWYIAVAETAILTVRNRLIEEIGADVGSGRILVEMTRPISVLSLRISVELGFMLPRFIVGFTLACCVGLVLGGRPPSLFGVMIALPSLLLALVLNVVGQHVFAAASFWVQEAKGAWFLYNKLVFVLGGMLLPLEVLPAWLETIAKILPFMAMAYIPSRLAAGFIEPELIAVQLLWLVALGTVASRTFARGERHLMRGGA